MGLRKLLTVRMKPSFFRLLLIGLVLLVGCDEWAGFGEVEPTTESRYGRQYPLRSDCICRYSSGTYGAWFKNKPSAFGKTGNVEIYSQSCSDLRVCEQMPIAGGYQYNTYQGRIVIDIENWQRQTNYINGSEVYTAFGRPSQASHSAREFARFFSSPTFIHAVTNVRRVMNEVKLVNLTQQSNDIASCSAACAANSPYCFSTPLSAEVQNSLQDFYSIVNFQEDGVIDSNTISEAFGVKDNPCSNSGIKLFNGEFSSKGDECFVNSSIDDFQLGIQLTLPVEVAGTIERGNNEIKVNFSKEASSPVLWFDDTGLNEEWGGVIKNIYANTDQVTLGVGEASCVQTTY